MSINKIKPIILAILTGTVFLPWKIKRTQVYWGIFNKEIEYGYQRAAGWLLILFCIFYLILEIFIDKEGKTIYVALRKYLTWSFVYVLVFDMLMISFNSGYGFYLPGIGIIIATLISVLFRLTNKRK